MSANLVNTPGHVPTLAAFGKQEEEMTTAEAAVTPPEEKGGGLFGLIEKIGNKVPHPVLMFLYLIIGLMVLSHVLFPTAAKSA